MAKQIIGAFVQTFPKFGKNRENIEGALELASKTEADLYVFPELCNTGYAFTSKQEARNLSESFELGSSIEYLSSFSEKKKCVVVAGLAENDRGKVYNSSAIVERGDLIGRYRKTHLFYREKMWFSPGNTGFKVFNVRSLGCTIGILVCFDWIFPEATRELALKGADIICHPSNLVLPGKAQQGMVTRAFENRVFVITANRVGRENRGPKDNFKFTGKSQIISPSMEILASANETETIAKGAKLDLGLARNKRVTSLNDLFKDRRPEYYSVLRVG